MALSKLGWSKNYVMIEPGSANREIGVPALQPTRFVPGVRC
jgi:hypothetical protein